MPDYGVAEPVHAPTPEFPLAMSRPARLKGAGDKLALLALIWLVAVQVSAVAFIGNGLSPTADPYSEADMVRSAQHYADYGFLADAGLPHIIYGNRFPDQGWVRDKDRFPLRQGVYTRYPPLPNLIGGLLEVTVGFQHLWLWRVVPISCGILALIYAYFTLRPVLGAMTASMALLFTAMAPMTSTHMHALHYEGYAQALFVAELALLARHLFSGEAITVRTLAALCINVFLQGCFSFEYAFIAAGAAIPLAGLARAYGRRVRSQTVVTIVILSAASFAIAHLLHFWQVTHFYGSMAAAWNDFSSRAAFRFSGADHVPYLSNVLAALLVYARILWLSPESPHFGPLLALVSVAVLTGWGQRASRMKGVAGALKISYVLSAIWLFVMPSHSLIHVHIIPRLFFLAYFVASFDLALRISARLPDLKAGE